MDPRIRQDMEDAATMVRGVESSHREERLDRIVVINRAFVWRRDRQTGFFCDRRIIFLEEGSSCICLYDYSFSKELQAKGGAGEWDRCFV
jgi:hypothetical protein